MVMKLRMFEHKNIHEQTWISNYGITRNQIDPTYWLMQDTAVIVKTLEVKGK